jgi:hypothetical protein
VVIAGQVDVLPLEGGKVGEGLVVHGLAALADRGDRLLQIYGIPENHGGDHEI